MSAVTTDYFSIVIAAPTVAPSVAAGETAFRFNTANNHLYTWDGTAWRDVTGSGGGGALTSLSNQLAADVAMTNANQFYDGPSVSLTAGTWLVSASIHVRGVANSGATAKLWDGTTAAASAYSGFSEEASVQFSLIAIVTVGTTTVYRAAAAGTSAGYTLKAQAALNPAGNTASTIVGVKIA